MTLVEGDIYPCPGLGGKVGDTVRTGGGDPRTVSEIAGEIPTGLTYTAKHPIDGKVDVPLHWRKKKYWWFVPRENTEETWAAPTRPAWYWEVVGAAVSAYREPSGKEDLALVAAGITAVFGALGSVLHVSPVPRLLPDLGKRVVTVEREDIGLLARLSASLAEESTRAQLKPEDIRGLGGTGSAREKARERIRALGEGQLISDASFPAISLAHMVAVHRAAMADSGPDEENTEEWRLYRLTLKSGQHRLARRHLLTHELMHAHSSFGRGLQWRGREVDEVYTELVARMVTDTLTAAGMKLTGSKIAKDDTAQEQLAAAAQYNVFAAESVGAFQAAGGLRYQQNLWALTDIARREGVPAAVTAELNAYFLPDGTRPGEQPAAPQVLTVVCQDAGPGSQSSVQPAPTAGGGAGTRRAALYLPLGQDADYHLLVTGAHAVLIDCGCAHERRAGGLLKRLRATLKEVLPQGPDGRPRLDHVVLSGTAPRRYNLVSAATRDVTVGTVHHVSSACAFGAPQLGGGKGTGSSWLAGRRAQPLPPLSGGHSKPLLCVGAASIHALAGPVAESAGLPSASPGQAGSAGPASAVLLAALGGLRVLLTSDCGSSAVAAARQACEGPDFPGVFSAPAAMALVTGRPRAESLVRWPWTGQDRAAPAIRMLAGGSGAAGPAATPARVLAAARVTTARTPSDALVVVTPDDETTLGLF
ncbi:hypothetical protein [Streptomyces sp. NPDC048340]|uniref:hypothetical protein n=1 Tax=Streptomyces sp. NPDC048340 TaxID=3365537 RepID=UPI00371AEC31